MCNCIGGNFIGQLYAVALLPLFGPNINKYVCLDMRQNCCIIRAPVHIVYKQINA